MNFWSLFQKYMRLHFLNLSADTHKRYLDGVVALLLFLLAQLLICGIHHVTANIDDFPAPIFAMLVIAVVMIVLSWLIKGVDGFYQAHLRGPTDLLNRHMSIGFTVPFTMILSAPTPTSRDVGLIISGFIVTGILNSGFVYLSARGLQALVHPSTCWYGTEDKHENTTPKAPTMATDTCNSRRGKDTLTPDRSRNRISKASTLTNNPSDHDDSDAEAGSRDEHDGPPGELSMLVRWRQKAFHVLKSNPIMSLSLFSLPTIGLPVALKTGNGTPFDTFLLLFLWTGTLAAQSATKNSSCLRPFPKRRVLLTTILNAVLWSSLGIIAYIPAKSAIKQISMASTLRSFATGTTFADLIHPVVRVGAEAGTMAPMGAGDVALSILNTGIAAWGLKLFECRSQLLSRAGTTTLLVGSVSALANVVCGPLLLHAMGLRPGSRVLAFAARSVTLALAGPAMASLGGDVGLNAAMVVFNGIVFQMAMGLGVVSWAERLVSTWKAWRSRDVEAPGDAEKGLRSSGDDTTVEINDNSGRSSHVDRTNGRGHNDSPRIVATGVAVGINAAAMGTAYLYEDGSRAAPYAALSMTIFGIMTVVFTSIQPLAGWLVAHVS